MAGASKGQPGVEVDREVEKSCCRGGDLELATTIKASLQYDWLNRKAMDFMLHRLLESAVAYKLSSEPAASLMVCALRCPGPYGRRM